MVRHDFKLVSPYREILHSDATKPFENELFPDGHVLADLIAHNTGNSYVIVYDDNDDILSFMWFYDHGSYFYIEFIATNRKFNSKFRSSSRLIDLLVGIGKELKYKKIELLALEDSISFYRKHGFDFVGDAVTGNYGIMSKMTKSLS